MTLSAIRRYGGKRGRAANIDDSRTSILRSARVNDEALVDSHSRRVGLSRGTAFAEGQEVANTTKEDGVLTTGAPPAVEVHAWKEAREYFNATFDDVRTDTGKILDVQSGDTFEIAQMLGLQGLYRMPKGGVAYTEIYIEPFQRNNDPQELYVENMYVDLPSGKDHLWRIGKALDCAFGIAPFYGNRKTSNYSPLSEAFTETPVVGVQYLPNPCSDGLSLGVVQSRRCRLPFHRPGFLLAIRG